MLRQLTLSSSQLTAIYSSSVEILQENGKGSVAVDLAKFCAGEINKRCEEEKVERNNGQVR